MKSKKLFLELLAGPSTLSQIFHEKTKIKKLSRIKNARYWPKEWKTIYYKSYPRLNEVILPKPKLPSKLSLKDALSKRASIRKFSKFPLSIADISALLYFSVGMKDKLESRFYPSAGSRYPLEIYIISVNSALPKGLFHYYLKRHSLEELILIKSLNVRKYFNQSWIEKAGIIILITAVFKRNLVKYGERGYRHILFEAGHMAENFYLVSAGLNLACCAIDGYIDKEIENLVDIDGINESVLYVMSVGNK